jgi:hypothetical protein
MASKKSPRFIASSKKGGFVLYHGIKIAPAEGKRSEAAKIIEQELRQRARGERKSA